MKTLWLASSLALLVSAPGVGQAPPPEAAEDRAPAFFQEGPAWLLPEARAAEVAQLDAAGRTAFVDAFYAGTEHPGVNPAELAEAITRRTRLARREFLSPLEIRYRLLFLRGQPDERVVVDCGQAYVPLEIWSWRKPGADPGDDGQGSRDDVVVFQETPGQPWRLWLPFDGKRVLYTSEMVYLLQQWHESNNVIFRARRFDVQFCEKALRIDDATGVRGLIDFRDNRPSAGYFRSFIAPPADLAAWVREVLTEPVAEEAKALPITAVRVGYPGARGQRLIARFAVELPAEAPLQSVTTTADNGEEKTENRVVIEGLLESGTTVFESFRVRFTLPPESRPRALVFERALRAGENLRLRLKVRDEVGGAVGYLTTAVRVPRAATPEELPPLPEEALVVMAQELATARLPGADSLFLVPPAEDVVLATWRAEAVVSGTRIVKVAFVVDGKAQLSDSQAPFSADLRLSQFPTLQIVRAEGYDAAGQLVAADEVILNQPRGSLSVRILEPKRGVKVSGAVKVRAEVVVPEERRIREVVFELDGRTMATLQRPPWEATIDVPQRESVTVISVRAVLDDDLQGEDTRILNNPGFATEELVDLVELYAAVTDRQGRPVTTLVQENFQILDEGKAQKIERFEQVRNLPLTLGVVIDTSGSMSGSIGEAQRAAKRFVEQVVKPTDRAFALAFSDKPELLVAPTSDVGAVTAALDRVVASGFTTLHDAVVTSLYYFRGISGQQRAMVLLSDGDDTKSFYGYREALEFARRSGVAIYSIGLNIGITSPGARKKLTELAEETGGRSFYIDSADELATVYAEIEQELRTRYFLAFAPNLPPGAAPGFRPIEVKVPGPYKLRTAKGYYR